MLTKERRSILRQACPRCRGDLLYDTEENEYACLQCGRPALVVTDVWTGRAVKTIQKRRVSIDTAEQMDGQKAA